MVRITIGQCGQFNLHADRAEQVIRVDVLRNASHEMLMTSSECAVNAWNSVVRAEDRPSCAPSSHVMLPRASRPTTTSNNIDPLRLTTFYSNISGVDYPFTSGEST